MSRILHCTTITGVISVARETIQRMFDIARANGYSNPCSRRLAITVANTIAEGLDGILSFTADVDLVDREAEVSLSIRKCRVASYSIGGEGHFPIGKLYTDAMLEWLTDEELPASSSYGALLRLVGLSLGDLDHEYRHRLEHYIDCRFSGVSCRNILREDWLNFRNDIEQHARFFRRFDVNTSVSTFEEDMIEHAKIEPHHYGSWTETRLETERVLPKTQCYAYYAHGRQLRMPGVSKQVCVHGKHLFCKVVNRRLIVTGKDFDTVARIGCGLVSFSNDWRKFWTGQHVEATPDILENLSSAAIVLNQALEGNANPDDIDWFLGLIWYDVIDIQSDRTYTSCIRKSTGHRVTVPLSAAYANSLQWLTDGDRLLMRTCRGGFMEMTGNFNVWKCIIVGAEQVTEKELRQCRVSVSRAIL